MSDLIPVVFVVDDDAMVRDAIGTLVRSMGLQVELFGSAEKFLLRENPDRPSCLVLDVRLPGVSGIELQRKLIEKQNKIPVIFITGHGDIPMSVSAMKNGAVEFLTKPFRDQDLLDAIHTALKKNDALLREEAEVAVLRGRLRSLTQRETQVLPWMISGLPTKQIAVRIGTTEAATKVHRSQLMRKMGANSLPELVRMAEKLQIRPHRPRTLT